ncbi:MAG: class I SAM-dependent methyltransferase [Segniliparus sp.]|uniref:class I SAM-dependent methyltransferase n=1 Tax=Segniliparus sp. TaxID=2804064 RepID=UPI003F316CDD
MAYHQLLFRAMYFVGFTPWDGHLRPDRLTSLVEGGSALPPGRALDVGCGTGDAAIYLAQHGWRVTGVDFTPKALEKARRKAAAAGADVDFVRSDVAELREAGLTPGFDLVLDFGLLHGTDDETRAGYAREVTALAAPGGTLLLVGFLPGEGGPVRGIGQAELLRALGQDWALVDSGVGPHGPLQRQGSMRWYELRRAV